VEGLETELVAWRDRERHNLSTPLLRSIAQHVARAAR
jgi:hypothetical protein